jgi:molecular chaperone GrpE
MKMKTKKKHQENEAQTNEELQMEELQTETELKSEDTTDNPDETANASSAEESEKKHQETEEKLRRQNEELRDSNLRLAAEFDNYRKRTIRERIELSKTASEQVIVELLTILDDFDRAFQNIKAEDNPGDGFIEGIKLINSKLIKTLSGKGLEEINAAGQTFDTDYHEAISQLEAEDESKKNKIIDVVQKGYKLHGKVIRFAKVVVGV